jgi:(1->4)-alpha-D-glucan 1-alpha-D-glucosylmutase
MQLQDLLQKTATALSARRRLPEATYRLQFHAGFTFNDARALVPYLRDLGVSHAYASPYLQARPGSLHGYDITNHQALNPEIGTPEEHTLLCAALADAGLGQILDTVPNHMGIGGGNAWWMDVLENGPSSPYAGSFDIAWQSSPRPELRDKVLLPVLGDPYGKALESGQLRLGHDSGAFTLHYFDHTFPTAPDTYALILSARLPELEQALPAGDPALIEFQSILTAIAHLPARPEVDPARVAERQREKEVVKRRLATLARDSEAVRAALDRAVSAFNGTPGDPHSFDALDALLDQQAYRLTYWRVASDEINYRRFFDLNDLAALSMEKPEVFAAAHELTFRLLREGKLDGLRIDHPDGLYDPRTYLRRLQRRYALDRARSLFEADPACQGLDWEQVEGPLGERIEASAGEGPSSPFWRPLYVVVEKILGPREALPADWPTYGTSGYDFLNAVNGLFVDGSRGRAFTRLYQDWTSSDTPFPELAYQKKLLILSVSLSSELHMLAYQLDRLAQKHRWSRDFTLHSLRQALRQVIACFPVYRSYISDEGAGAADRRNVEAAVKLARARNPTLSPALFAFVRNTLLQRYPDTASEEDRAEQRHFAGKFQQVTAPVVAKGVEDTAFYVYNRLVSLNEVGGDPGRFGNPPEAVHRYNGDRQASWPWALSPLSTHDTKRSGDVRARINVLSEIPDEWRGRLERWAALNEAQRPNLDDEPVPGRNEEYLLYQTLLGAWPLEPYSEQEYADFVKRIQAYLEKALHEAKVHTSWVNPNPAYDEAVGQFIARILDESASGAFLEDFRSFQRRVSHLGLLNSLAQTLLQIASPGAPDLYQGTELWDFSLVDPDNRRPVDYELRRQLLASLRARLGGAGADRLALARELLQGKEDGRVKLYVTTLALNSRRDNPGLFSAGEYLPVLAAGPQAEHVFAFARRHQGRVALAAVPRLLAGLLPEERGLPLGRGVWQETRLQLPAELEAGLTWHNVFTGEVHWATEGGLPVAEVFGHFPVALLFGEPR